MKASKTSAEMGLPGRVHMSRKQAEYHATLIVQGVAELGDRTSPEDMPEMMLVTGEELKAIVVGQLLD